MIYAIIAIIILVVLYLLALTGRTGHKGLRKLRGWGYAHRGLHGNGVPENSMLAFRKALEGGYGIEFDVHLMKDGNLAIIHDSSLKRTAGADVLIEDLTVEDLENYRLEGTDEKIPLFSELLDLYAGKAPLIIELKAHGNHAELSKAVCDAMEGYKGVYCMESFDPRVVQWLRKNRPEIIRGQLASNFFRGSGKMPFILKLLMTSHLTSFLTCPDFIAYKFADRKSTLSLWFCRKQMESVTWTITSQADHDTAVQEGWIPIFEGFRPPIN
jgi:glycerophosphoryl diester phosphodiesterase